jgi:hypothetical protein
MQFLITYKIKWENKSFYSDYFDFKNDFNPSVNMIVYDLVNHKYMDYRGEWLDVEYNHL